MIMVMDQGSSLPPSGFEEDPLAECHVFGSSGSVVQPSATPEDISAYVGPRLRAALEHITGPLMLLDVVRCYQSFHRELFPTLPAASVLTVLMWLPGFVVEETRCGPPISWGESSSYASGSSPRTAPHHPDGYSNDSALASASTSSSARDFEVSSAITLIVTRLLPLALSIPSLLQLIRRVISIGESDHTSGLLESSSGSSSPVRAFRPIRAARDHQAWQSPRYSSGRSSPWSSPVSTTASTQLVSPGSSSLEAPYPSPNFTSSDDTPLKSPTLVRHIRAAVVSLLIILQHCPSSP